MLKSLTFSFSIFKLTTIAIILFYGNLIGQIEGDLVHVESTYAKKYKGTINKADKEGYFIKTSNNREIYLSKLEIKTIKVVLGLVEPNINDKVSTTLFIDSNDVNRNDTNSLKETPELEFSEEIKSTAEISEFYIKYELANFDISSFNSLEKSKDYKKFKRELSRHLNSKNFSLNFGEKIYFYKYLPKELEIYPNETFKKYQQSKRRGKALMVLGGIGLIIGNILTFEYYELTGIGLGGFIVAEVGLIKSLRSDIWLYKSFLTYLKERQ